MFVRYLGRGISHGGNTTDIETPMAPDDEPEGTLTAQPDEGRRREGDSKATSESEDEDTIYGDGRGRIENKYSDEEPEVKL